MDPARGVGGLGLAGLGARDFEGVVAEAVVAAIERAHELGAQALAKLAKRG